jgi:hypothetical protein
MNHRVFWSLSALVASVTLQAQGYLESERWVGWIQPSTEVYVDEDTRRLLLVDRQLDYVQLRYSAQGSGLKPTQIQRIPLSKWGSATVLGFSRGEVIVDSSSRSGGTVYRFGLDSSFKAEVLAPVFQDSLRVLGSQLLDIDRRAEGASIASKMWMDGQLRLQNQIVLAAVQGLANSTGPEIHWCFIAILHDPIKLVTDRVAAVLHHKGIGTLTAKHGV